MSALNGNRVIAGGLLAGLVVNFFEFLVNGVLLADSWREAMKSINRTSEMSIAQLAIFNAWGFLIGIAAVWLYAILRDRYQPGPGSALRAAVAVWAVAYFAGTISGIGMGLFPLTVMLTACAAGFVEIIAGTLVGAWIYRPASA